MNGHDPRVATLEELVAKTRQSADVVVTIRHEDLASTKEGPSGSRGGLETTPWRQ